MKGMWLCATLFAATLMAAPSFAQGGGGDWADTLFGVGGNAESGVKSTTVDSPDKKPGAQTLTTTTTVAKDGNDGKDGENGQDGKNGKDGKDGKNGATRTILRTGKPGRNGRDSKLADYPGDAKGLWECVAGATQPHKIQWWCLSTLSTRLDKVEETQKTQADAASRRREAKNKQKKKEKDMQLLIGAIVGAFLITVGMLLLRAFGGGNGGGAAAAAAAGTETQGRNLLPDPPAQQQPWTIKVLEQVCGANSRIAAATITEGCLQLRMAGTKEELAVASEALRVEKGTASVSLPGCSKVERNAGQPVAPAPTVVRQKVGRRRLEEAIARAMKAQAAEKTAVPASSPVTVNITNTADAGTAAATARQKKEARAESPTPAPNNGQVIPPDDVPKD